MTKKFEYPVSNWCFDKLEQRILLSGEAMIEPVEQPNDAGSSDEASADVLTANEKSVEKVAGIKDYQPEVDGALVDLQHDGVLPKQSATAAEIHPENAGLTDIHLTPDQALEAPNGLVVDGDEILTGSGSIKGAVVNDGKVSPGNSPGIQSVQSYSQTADGTLVMEVAGTGNAGDANGFDQINVAGNATFDGTLEIKMLGNFTPTAGQVYDIINYTSYSGKFSEYKGLELGNGLSFRPIYSANKLQLEVIETPGGMIPEFADSEELVKYLDFIADAANIDSVTVNGSFSMAGQTLAGEFTFSFADDHSGYEVLVSNLTAEIEGGDASISLVNGSGALFITDSGVAGSLTGDVRMDGLTGVVMSGSATYTFNTTGTDIDRTVGAVSIDLASDVAATVRGNMNLKIDNLADMQGSFVIEQIRSGNKSSLRIDGSAITSRIGSGATLSNGWVAMVVTNGDSGMAGYALSGSADVALSSGSGITMSSTATLKANTLRRTVDESFNISGTQRAIKFDAVDQVHLLDVGNLDMTLNAALATQLDAAAQRITSLKDKLVASVDENGNITEPSILAETVPGTDATLESLLGMTDLFKIGDYIRAYLKTITGAVLTGDAATIPVGDYSATGGVPTLQGLYAYLKAEWTPAQTGGLVLGLVDDGFKLGFNKTITTRKSIEIDFGKKVSGYGLTLDDKLVVDVDVANKVDFGVVVDWNTGSAAFELGNMDYEIRADLNDLQLDASYGALAVQLGNDSRGASLEINLTGRLGLDSSNTFTNTVISDRICAELPVFATIGGESLGGGEPATIVVEGSPLTSNDEFNYRVKNFDSFKGFSSFTVGDLILMFPEFMDMLESMQNSDSFAKKIPFVEGTLDQVFNFASGFDKAVYSKIDFNRPQTTLLDNLSGTVTKGTTAMVVGDGITLTSALLNQYVTFEDGVTRQIRSIDLDTRTITFNRAFKADASLSGLSVKTKKEQIKTVQEFTNAINKAGIMPAGMTVEYDVATGKFMIPIAFEHNLTPLEKELVFDFDMGELSGLNTTAKGVIKPTVRGGFKLFFDLGDASVSGKDGSIQKGKTTFTSDSANFDDSLVGYTLEIDGYTYKVVSVTNSTTLELDKAATVAVSGAAYVLNEAARIGVEDVSISADMSLTVNDPVVAAKIGYLGVTVGGVGSGSKIQVLSSATGSLTKDSGSKQFTIDEITSGSFMDSFAINLTGSASAVLKRLTVNPGLGSDIPVDDTAQVALYVQDFITPGSTVKVSQPIANAFDLKNYVDSGKATASDTVLVTPDLGDSFAFKDASFLDIIRALRMGIDFIEQGVGQNDFYNANIPLINTSLADTLSLADDFLAVLERAGANPAGTLQEVESCIEKALGISENNNLDTFDQSFALYLGEGGILGIHLDYKQFFSKLFTFNLDLKTLQNLAGGQLAALAGLDMLSDKQGRGAAANIKLDGFFDLQLDAGLRFPDDSEPEIFLFDSDPDNSAVKRGTKATLAYRVEGTDLNMAFDAGPLSLGVEGGVAVIDGDGRVDTKDDYATLVVHLDQLATDALEVGLTADELARIPETDDGRFMFAVYKDGKNVGPELLKFNLKPEVSGRLFVDLPVRLDFGGIENNFSQHLVVSMAPGADLGDLMPALNAPDGVSIQPIIKIQTPNIVQKFEALGGSFGLMSILNDPGIVIDGIDDSLAMIQDVFLDGFGVKLPLIGDVLGDFSGFINDIRIDLLADLRQNLTVEGGLIRLVQQSYFDVFSTKLHILQDSDRDGDIDIDDVLVGWYDTNSVKLGDWALDGEIPIDVDSIQFDMKLGGNIVGANVDIPLDIDLPGFNLELDGGFALDMDWSLDFGTGISGAEGFYMVAQNDDDPEFQVDVDILLDSDVKTKAIEAFNGVGKLAFFKATLTDKDHNTSQAGFQASGLKGSYHMDFVGDNRGRMGLNYLNSTPMDKVFVDEFNVDTDIDMGIVLEVDSDKVPMPKLVADLVIDWDYSSVTGMDEADIGFKHFGIDVDSLVNDFLLPITEQVSDVLSPLDPVISSLYTKVPGLDMIGVHNVMDVIDTCMQLQGKDAMDWGFVKAVKAMIDMPDTVRGWADNGGIIYLGDITGLGTENTSAQEKQSPEDQQRLAKLEAQEDSVDKTGNGGAGKQSARTGFRYMEYITDLSNWMSILTGGDATLFTYEMPIMKQAASVDVPIYGVKMGPAKFGVFATGDISLAADMAFGYDTSGLRKSMNSGNPIDAFDGFYVSNVTMPEFRDGSIVPGTGGLPKPEVMFDVSIGLEAGVNAGVVAGGLTGEIVFDADLDLKDIEKSVLTKDAQGYVTKVEYEDDGKVRMSEIMTMYGYEGKGYVKGFGNLFNLETETRVEANAYVDVKIPLVGKKRVVDQTLFKKTLYEKDFMAPTVKPTLGVVNGGVLTINAGSLAENRKYFNTDDFGESFWLYGDSGEVAIEFDGWYKTYSNINKVVIDLGDGDDMLDASRLSGVFVDVRGGAGDDVILLGDGGGHVRGEDGNDTITVMSGNTGTILDGGAGKDKLTGAAGDDTLIGGSGNDRLYGNAGADSLEGGSGADQLRGGAGNDTYVFKDNYGADRFSDTQGEISLDFSGVTAGLDISVGRNGVSAVNADSGEFRISTGKVTSIVLGSGDDNVRINSFVDWSVDITDNGGNDDYRFTMGRSQARGASGTYNVTDTLGDFDEVIATQTRLDKAIFINSGQVENGREVVNFDAGIDRLTLAGKGSNYNGSEIKSFGGDVFYDTKASNNISNLGSTGFRAVADEVRMDSAVKASHVILDSLSTLTVDERLIATSNGYVDIRAYGNNADIIFDADVIVSAGSGDAGDGAGWIRMISADGSILRGASGAEILAAGSYLQLKAHNAIGTKSSALLTNVKDLTAVTNARGTGDIVITESDDLNVIVERTLSGVEDAGFRFDTAHGEDHWESKVDWDDAATADWTTLLQSGRTDYAVEVGNGDFVLTQTGKDALLTLESGVIHTKKADGDISLTVDDIDFKSGAEKVIGTGDLNIRANQQAWKYLFGYAAEAPLTGAELARDDVANLHTMSMGMRDFAALADGFNRITIGRVDAGNTMVIGDLLHATNVKRTPSVARDVQATLRDHTVFQSADIQIAGDVRADNNTVEFHGTAMSVGRQNYHDPIGLPDSGVRGENVIINVTDQLHVGGWVVGDDLIDIDVTASTGTNPTSSGAYVQPLNGIHSFFMDSGARIESLNANSRIDINTSHAMQAAGTLEAKGNASAINITAGTDFLLNEGGRLVTKGADSRISVDAGGVLALNSGSATFAGIRFAADGITPVLTGANADISLSSANEMLIAGSLTVSGGLAVSSGASVHDNAEYGDPDHASYLAQYTIYNKSAYFKNLKQLDADHYLADHDSGYGLMVTGTVTSLGENRKVVLGSNDDFILRGNIHVTGDNSDLTLHSDSFTYIEGFVDTTDDLTVLGGIGTDGTDHDGSDKHSTSVYLHDTAQMRTTGNDADIVVKGSKDVDVYGVLLAGGSVGQSGAIWSGLGADLSVSAGEQLLLGSGLLAAGNVAVKGGTPGSDDEKRGLLVTTAGGMTARGYQNEGGNITITGSGNMEMMGTLVAGGSLVQSFDDDGNLLSQHVNWSGVAGQVDIDVQGQAFIGGNTVTKGGTPTTTGGYIHSAGDVTIEGGMNESGMGVRVHGASEIAVKKADGNISITSAGDAEIIGLLAAGGQVNQVRDASGVYQGRTIETFGGASAIRIEAEKQIRVGVGLKAGRSIDLVGGTGSADTNSRYADRGIVLQGSAQLETWLENSTINLNAPGRIDVLAPAHTNEILAQAWPYAANGVLPQDVTLDLVLDKVSYDISATVTLSAADTADNTSINDLLKDIQAALEAADWKITRSDVDAYTVGDSYTDFADDPSSALVDPDMKVKLRDGRLILTGPYSMTLKSSSGNADLLGFDTVSDDLTSGLYYAIDARNAGSVVNLGAENGPNQKIYVAGKVIANKAINMYSGTSPDGKDIDIDATGVLETVNGSIKFNAGENGEIWGDIIAGGEGSDIILNADTSLTIRGNLKAYDDVIIKGGSVQSEGQESLRVEGTSKILSTGGGGELKLSGVNDVVINGVVGTGSNTLSAVDVSSEHGKVTVLKESGLITADTGLTISGKDVDIQGVIQSTAQNIDGAEVDIRAQRNLTVQADINVQADLALHAGNTVDIFNSAIEVKSADSTLTVTSDGDITSSKGAVASGHDSVPDGDYYYQGATIQGTGIVTFDAADELTIGNAVLVGTSEAKSKIVLEGSTVTVIGSALAGATVKSGSAEWTGAESILDINASERVNVGGEILNEKLVATQQGGTLQSSGDLTIDVAGGSNAVSLSQNSLSSITADALEPPVVTPEAGGDKKNEAQVSDAPSSHIAINTDHGIVLNGLVQANDAAGTVNITTGDQAHFNGVVEAGKNITVTAGDDDTGISILSEDHVYKRDSSGKYFVDTNGRLMDGLGNLVNADGKYVDEAGVLLADGVSPVKGADPVRLSGATFDVAAGGTIDFSAVDDIYLGGQVGRPVTRDGKLSANPVEINISSSAGNSKIGGLVNALNKVTVTGKDAAVLAGGVVRTRSDIGEVFFNVSGNILVAGDDGVKGAGMVTAAERVHFFGDNVRLDGNISATADAESLILANGVASVIVGGRLVSQGNVELRGGVGADWTEEQLTAASVDVSSLGDAYVKVVGAGSVHSEGDINITAGGDFGVASEAVLGDGKKAIQTPVITTKANKVKVVTGYNQVADGFITVPEVKWITTTVSEQNGSEEFKSGVEFKTMDVTLTQIGYYNAAKNITRQYFIEGNHGDYRNDDVNWGATGAKNPKLSRSGYCSFNSLNDLQKAAVLKHLGYKALYTFSSSNHKLHRVINGNATEDNWTPKWLTNAEEIVHINVAGWNDKYIRMPKGAAEDVLSVISKGDVKSKDVLVGKAHEKATVQYTQATSAHTASTYYEKEPWENDSNASIEVKITDNDGKDASWDVSYVSGTGSMYYTIYDGHTGSHVDIPDWKKEVTVKTHEGNSNGNKSELKANGVEGYFTDTGTLSNKKFVSQHTEVVGVDAAGGGFTKRYYQYGYDQGHGYSKGKVKFESKAEFDYLAKVTKKKFGVGKKDKPLLYKIGAYKYKGSRWHDGKIIPRGYGSVWGDESRIYFGSFDGKGYELHDTKRGSSKWIIEHDYTLTAGDVTEEFKDYTYDWTSKERDVYDSRKTLHYSYTSKTVDKYENRPTYRTYDTTTKKVLEKQITVWRNEAVYGDQTVFTTERVVEQGKLVGWGKFDSNALEAKGDINVVTGDDISVSGQVKGIGDASTVTMTAGGDITVDGAAPSGGSGDEISAEALIESPGEVRFDAVGTITFGDASAVRTTLDETDIIVNAGGDAVLNGDMEVLDSIVVQANDDINVGGHLKAANYIDIHAGQDGTGGFTGSEGSLLEVTATPDPVEPEAGAQEESSSDDNAGSDESGGVSASEKEAASDGEKGASDSGDGAHANDADADSVSEGDSGESTPVLLERKKGSVYLTSGKESGDMLLTGASITSLGSVELTAEGGAVKQTGGVIESAELIGLSKNGFTANTSIDTLTVSNTGDGGLSIVNSKALNIADFDTAGGGISVTTFGALNAGRLTTAGMGDDDDISIRVYGAGVTYDTIAVGEGGDGDISIKVQGSITNTGSESRMIGDEIAIEVPGEIDIVTVANSLDLHSYQLGDITVRDISDDGVNLKNIVAGEGEISVTAAGDVGVKNVRVISERRDFSLTSGGRIFGMNNGNQPMIVADQLTMSAQTGIEGLTTRTNELLDVQTATGDISFVNTEDATDNRADLTVTKVITGDGNISLTTDGVLMAYTAHAGGADSELLLRSTTADVVVRDTGAEQGIWSGSVLELDAADKLDLEVNVDAENDLILRSGEMFVIPTTGTYRADNITIESDENITLENDLVFGGGKIEFISKRDVVLTGSISSSDGSAVDLLKVTATADNPQVVYKRDADLQYVMRKNTAGDVVLETPSGHLVQHNHKGLYAYKAYYAPKIEGASLNDARIQPRIITVLTQNADGTGTIYALDGTTVLERDIFDAHGNKVLTAKRYTTLDKDFVDVTSHINPDDYQYITITKASSKITLDLGDEQFDTFEITAGGTTGVIEIDSNSDLIFDGGFIRASAEIDIATTGKLTAGENVIGGYNGDNPEIIKLTSGKDMVVDSELSVVDGQRWIENGMKPIEGSITLSSGGTITSTVEKAVARGTKLEISSVGDVALTTNVDKLDATVSGAGTLKIADRGSLHVENARIAQGMIDISAQSTLEVANAAMAANAISNTVVLTSFSSDVYVDFINAGTKGLVVVNAKGALRELSPTDPDNDIIANTLLALTDATTTDVEYQAPTNIIGRNQDIDLEINSDFYLFGDFGGNVNLQVHGTLYISDTSAKNYNLQVDEVSRVEGDLVTTGVLDLDAKGVELAGGASLSGNAMTLAARNEKLVMADGSSIAAGAGGMSITTSGDMVLHDVSSGADINLLSTDGAILDGNSDESANITAEGNAWLNAKNGIGVAGGEDFDTTVKGTLGARTTSGGIAIHDTANITVGDRNIQAVSGAVNLVADNDLAINGAVTSGDNAVALSGENVRLHAAGSINASSDVNIVASNGVFEQNAAATITSTDAGVSVDAKTEVTVASITADGDISIDAQTGAVTQDTASLLTSSNGGVTITAEKDVNVAAITTKDDVTVTSQVGTFEQSASSSITSSDGGVTVEAENAANIRSISAEGDVLVTSRTGTIFDLSEADSAAITSLNGVINLNAAVDVGKADKAMSVDGKVAADADGDIYLNGINGLRTGTGGITSHGGNVELSSTGEIDISHDVTVADGTLSIDGDSLQLKGSVVADSVTAVIAKLTSIAAEGSLAATDGSVEVTSGSIVQAGKIQAEGSNDITVTSTEGSIEMVDEAGTGVGGALITGDGTITYVSATDLKAGTFESKKDVYLTAQDGSIADAFDDAPVKFDAADFAKASLNVVAENLFAEATGKIGDPEGNALDVQVKNLSALSGEGTHIWARGGVQLVDPGLIVDGDGDLILYTDGDVSYDPDATTDPLYGVTGEGKTSFTTGFVVPPVAPSSGGSHGNWDTDSDSTADTSENNNPLNGATSTTQPSSYLEMLKDRNDDSQQMAGENVALSQQASVLSDVFGEDLPQRILEDMFEESGLHLAENAQEHFAEGTSKQQIISGSSLVEEIAEARGSYRESLIGDASGDSESLDSSRMSLLSELQSESADTSVLNLRFGEADKIFDSPVFGEERNNSAESVERTFFSDRNEGDFLQNTRPASELGILPMVDERDVDGLIQISEDMPGVQGGAASEDFASEDGALLQGLQPVEPEVSSEPVSDSQ